MKVIELKDRAECFQCIQFLKKEGSLNLYLYEGITRGRVLYWNFCLQCNGRTIGVIHTKNGEYIHIFLLKNIEKHTINDIKHFLYCKFPKLSAIFSEKDNLDNFLKAAEIGIGKKRDYFYMEMEKDDFFPVYQNKGIETRPEMASLLLPLQIQYEVEELGIKRSEISRLNVRAVLKKRLERKEITALFHGNKPIAMAGVNARFEDTCQIGLVYVVPGWRGKGVGLLIISSHVERLFKRYGKIVLFVDKKNEKAFRLYKNTGFHTAGELEQVHIYRHCCSAAQCRGNS